MDAYSSGEEVVVKIRKPYTITKQRERWTEEEHNKFLEALKLYGRAWQRIEEHIGTKTAVQIRSHAQKFFTKLEKEALVKGVPIGQALDIDIPPPRPKRKPINPYPRKTSAGAPTSHIRGQDGILVSVSCSHGKQAMDLEKEPHPEEPPCSFVTSADKNSLLVPLRNPCSTSMEFIPSAKEVTSLDENDESLVTTELKENQKLEIGAEGKHTEQSNNTSKASTLEDSDASHAKLVQSKKTDDLNCALTIEGMQGNQNYPRHVPVHVLDGKLGTGSQNQSQDVLFRESIFQPMGGVNGQTHIFTNATASNASENNSAQSSIHQPFPTYPAPFTQIHHNQDNFQSFLQMSSTFSSLIVSTLLQNPAAHATASFAATFWPYANIEAPADSPACSQGGFPSRQIGSPPSMAAMVAATVAAATAWWAAHGLLPLCAPFHSVIPCPPASAAAAPSVDNGEMPEAKTEQGGETTRGNPLQDQILDPEYANTLQAQHSASKSPAVSSSDSEESGGAKINTSAKDTDNEKNKANSEHPDSNKTKGRKQVDRSSCGSNTTCSSGVETDALEKNAKGKEETKEPDANHLAIDYRNRRTRSAGTFLDSWKEVSEEGRLAFQALFSREVLPQSFSPLHDLTYQDHRKDNIEDNKNCNSDCRGAEKNLSFIQKNNEEEVLLTIGLGQGKLKASRTGFKPYKRCSMEVRENRFGTTSSQGEEKGAKKIRLEAEVST